MSAGSVLTLCVAVLTFLGLVVLSSAGKSLSSNPYFYFQRQSLWLALALLAGIFTAFLNLDTVRKGTWVFVGAVLLLLVAVLVPGIGVKVNGASRWLDLGMMRLQVSDLGKLALIFGMAHFLAQNQRRIQSFWWGFVLPCTGLGLLCGLIMLEPDFGTTALCGIVGLCMLFVAGTRLLFLIPSGLMALMLFGVAVYLDPIRLRRVTSFLDVEANKSDSAYQLWQGILAFGAGGVDGVGLGNGRQQLSYLPESHTDFVFPVIGEELGFITTATVVALFLTVFLCGVWSLRRAPNMYQFLLVCGALWFLTFQALINMGVVTGLLPTKGMSLPFISYGGSNLVVMFILVGLILNCFRHWQKPALKRPRHL
ncbi:putative lipid II flippase FtsW [Ruficoccus sp. ZRK36]|uniref:putative lipid II flippase FtsW n=1 Tax=Ruficoccus sp. ZRK36 TaxID=2866311 RepID=UPI0021043E50|nr:putative lipid II flippase FtsW [Ruficoccus sp. ZRK36]